MEYLLSPDVQQFIEEKVRSGQYATPEDVITDAIARLRSADEAEMDHSLTPQDIAEIEEAEDSIERGEAIPWDEVAPALRKKYCRE